MNTETLITAVVARLAAKFTNPKPDIRKWPDDPNAKPQFTNGICAMWVGYNGSTFGESLATDHPVQERTRIIVVSLHIRSLHGDGGAAAYVDAVEEVLHGWQPSDGRRLEIASDHIGNVKDGVWRYDLLFRAVAHQIPILDSDSDEPGPALRLVTLLDPVGGDSEVASTEPPPEEP
jgi:hypothetical protein